MEQQEQSWIRSHRTLVIVAGAAVAVVLLAAFVSLRRGAVEVRAERVARGLLLASISTNGKIEPVHNFEAHAPAPGTVRKLLVREGERVRAGQLLLLLDDADARATAARALAQLKAAEADLKGAQRGGTQEEVLITRTDLDKAKLELDAAQRNQQALERLEKTGAASAAEVQEGARRLQRAQNEVSLLEKKLSQRFSREEMARIEARCDEARAAYAAAEDLVAKANVRSPIDGMVYSLPVKPAAFVSTGDLLVQVADLSRVLVRAFVDEPDIGRLAQGQKVEVTWDAVPGRTWEGTVTAVPTTVTLRGTRTVGEVTAQVDNADLKLLPNINVSVQVITARRENALSVPREAVHQMDGRRFVYEIADGELKQRPVETSISNLTRMEIIQGINEGAWVALGSVNGQALKPGMPVRVLQP